MKRLLSILLWSAISAAFIGPGTVTTASAAGAGFGFSLLWALLFSTAACLALQEASARLTIVTGLPLARIMCMRFVNQKAARCVPVVVVGAVVLGCAAYQAGNILGAVSGASLGLDLPPRAITLMIGLIAGVILFAGSSAAVARILGIVVALMGAAFVACAIDLWPDPVDLLRGCFVPSLPGKAGLLALGLVGTTVVPYNLFLGSGLARGQTLGQARFGLAVAIPLGGLISMAILVAGTAVQGDFSFEALSSAFETRLGQWAGLLFAFGLFAAGLSSAITAPLAAALSVKGLASAENSHRWNERSRRYRAVWGGVLLFGLGFGLADIRPIPVIILAQALNGVILPLVAVFLWITVNDRKLLGDANLPGFLLNSALALSSLIAVVMGTSGLIRAGFAVLGYQKPGETAILVPAACIAALLSVPVFKKISYLRKH